MLSAAARFASSLATAPARCSPRPSQALALSSSLRRALPAVLDLTPRASFAAEAKAEAKSAKPSAGRPKPGSTSGQIAFFGRTNDPRTQIFTALHKVYGVGKVNSTRIMQLHGLMPNLRLKQVPEPVLRAMESYVERNYTIERQLRAKEKAHMEQILKQANYRADRLRMNLPAHGGRTRSNASSARRRTRIGTGRRGNIPRNPNLDRVITDDV
eukprot:TRINITY_DN23269_c0_g1_i1.p1 TRINITY_DN23269_c0_g1~~TRINITY_DN23269_c0_g1_i1.p1  ORF type:complete len:213 (-),score=34.27 TRINITY_DN23269_c0_g1_i1:36-674(-)